MQYMKQHQFQLSVKARELLVLLLDCSQDFSCLFINLLLTAQQPAGIELRTFQYMGFCIFSEQTQK